MQKKCLGCARTYTFSGSGKRQRYRPKCAKRSAPKGTGIIALQPIDNKASIRAQILEHGSSPNPAQFTAPNGHKGRVWLAGDSYKVGCDLHWKVHAEEAIKLAGQARKEASKFPEPVDLMNGARRGKAELRKAASP